LLEQLLGAWFLWHTRATLRALYTDGWGDYTARSRPARGPAGHVPDTLRIDPMQRLLDKKTFLIKPYGSSLSGKMTVYRGLSRKNVRLNGCCTKPRRGSFLAAVFRPFLSCDELSLLDNYPWMDC